jgi:hypothetical protein
MACILSLKSPKHPRQKGATLRHGATRATHGEVAVVDLPRDGPCRSRFLRDELVWGIPFFLFPLERLGVRVNVNSHVAIVCNTFTMKKKKA